MDQPRHVPVLLDRVLELFAPALSGKPAVVVDTTLGMGGHSDALLSAHPDLTLIGLDRDPQTPAPLLSAAMPVDGSLERDG